MLWIGFSREGEHSLSRASHRTELGNSERHCGNTPQLSASSERERTTLSFNSQTAFRKSQTQMKRVRNVLLRSSIVGVLTSSSSTYVSTARKTVALKLRSMSAQGGRTTQRGPRTARRPFHAPSCTFSWVSTTFSSPSFLDLAAGKASTLSEPLVPHETSCRLQKA